MADEKKNALKIDESTKVREESLGSKFNAGIHENVLLTEIEYKVPEGDKADGAKWIEALDFTFTATVTSIAKDNNGNVLRDTGGTPVIISKAGDIITTRQFYDVSEEEKSKNTLSRIKHIMTKFMDSSEAVLKGDSFKELSAKVSSLLEGKTSGVKLRLKVIKGSNDYGEIAGYTPFVEKMSTPTSQLKLSDKERKGQAPTSLASLGGGSDREISLPGIT